MPDCAGLNRFPVRFRLVGEVSKLDDEVTSEEGDLLQDDDDGSLALDLVRAEADAALESVSIVHVWNLIDNKGSLRNQQTSKS